MIIDIFSAAVQFFCEKMDKLLMLLTTDLTTFQNGAIWNAIEIVYTALLSVGLTIAGILIWFGLLQSTDRYVELKKPSVWLKFLAEIILINALMMPANAFTNASFFTLRSGGRSFITFLYDSVYIWILAIPVTFCLVTFTDLPIIPIYAVCYGIDIVKCLIGYILVKKRIWVNNLVADS